MRHHLVNVGKHNSQNLPCSILKTQQSSNGLTVWAHNATRPKTQVYVMQAPSRDAQVCQCGWHTFWIPLTLHARITPNATARALRVFSLCIYPPLPSLKCPNVLVAEPFWYNHLPSNELWSMLELPASALCKVRKFPLIAVFCVHHIWMCWL